MANDDVLYRRYNNNMISTAECTQCGVAFIVSDEQGRRAQRMPEGERQRQSVL